MTSEICCGWMRSRIRWTLIVLMAAGLLTGGWRMWRARKLDRLRDDCAALARDGEWELLETKSAEWIRRGVEPAALYWQGLALKHQGRFLEAEPVFAQVPLEGPRGIDSAVERMEILFHVHNRPLDALSLGDELLRLDQRLASPRRHRIYFLAMTLQRAELAEEILTAIRLGVDLPEHYIYLLTLDDLAFQDAADVTRRWREASPDDVRLNAASEIRRLQLARALWLESPTESLGEDYRRVRDEARPVLEASAEDSAALEALLLLGVEEENLEDVERWLSQVGAEAAQNPVVWRVRGWYAARQGDYDQALEAYERAISINPLSVQSRSEYAGLLRVLNRGEEAGQAQVLSARGQELISEARRLPHVQEASADLLLRLANYLRDCGELSASNGILRRLQTSA
ncbi:MAG: tetratricopeptide repeat protein [Planctomyces sp.]|nr:tetratricopeptide repeat protein [Planctomyces sp.]